MAEIPTDRACACALLEGVEAFSLTAMLFAPLFETYQASCMATPLSCRAVAFRTQPSFQACMPRPVPIPKPSLRVTEEQGGLVITATLPGYDQNDVRVHLADGVLTLAAAPGPSCDCWRCASLALPPLRKSFRLGPHIDCGAVTAEWVERGVLVVRLPRKVYRPQPRVIVTTAPAPAFAAAVFGTAPSPTPSPRLSQPCSPPAAAVPLPNFFRQQPCPPPAAAVPVPAFCSQRLTATTAQPATARQAPCCQPSPHPAAAPARVLVRSRPAPAQPAVKVQRSQARRIPVTDGAAASTSVAQPTTTNKAAPAGACRPLKAAPQQQQQQQQQPAAAAAEQAAADPKGKQPMSPEQEADFLAAQAEAKRAQARLSGQASSSDSDEEDGSIEDCDYYSTD